MNQQMETASSSVTNINFTCKIEDLMYGMGIAKKTLGSGKNVPILAGVKMEIGTDNLTLSSTNLEMFTNCSIPITNETDSAIIVLKGEVLAKIIQSLPKQGKVQFKSSNEEDQKIMLKAGDITFDLFQLPPEDFPTLSSPPKETVCKIDTDLFREALKQTTFAALQAKETTRLSLTGVDMILSEEQLKMVATNGYRMTIKTIPVQKMSEEKEFLVEAGALKDLNRILSQAEADYVDLFVSESEIFFSVDGILFSDKLIMEDFPEFEGVIPQNNDLPLHLNRSAFLDTLQRAEITASEESGAVLLETDEGGEVVHISSSSPEKGELEENIPLNKPSKGEIKVSFKAGFLIDALRRMHAEKLTLWLSNSETAGLLEPFEEEGDFIYVCMPISLDKVR